MFRIDTVGATEDNKFTEGSPSSGTRATVVSAEWLNSLQEEVANVIEGDGEALSKTDNEQLSKAFGRRVRYARNIAEMEALSLSAGTTIYLAEEGRSGDFLVKSGAAPSDPENGIYVVLANGNYAARADRQTVTVEMFGAVGDGADDDSAALAGVANYINTEDLPVHFDRSYLADQATTDLLLSLKASNLRGFGAIIDPNGNRIPLGNEYKTRGLFETRNVPNSSAFSWLDILPTVHGVGNVDASESAVNYAKRIHAGLIGSGVVYVDPVYGDDANVGNFANPVATISEAVRLRNPSQIYLLGSSNRNSPAIFRKFEFRTTDTPGAKLKIITAVGHCAIEEDGDDLSALTWTSVGGATPNVYQSPPLTGAIPPRAVLWSKYQDTNGGPLRIPERASVTEINTEGYGWYFDGSALFIRLQARNIESIKSEMRAVYADSTSRCLIYGTKAVFEVEKEGSLVFNGVKLSPLEFSGARAEVFTGPGVTINYSNGHGVDSLGADTIFEGLEVFAAKLDNIHYGDSGGLGCRALEINCISFEAGDVATQGGLAAGTDNGSAMHGTGHIARYAGRYFNNNGPDVVDSSSGHYWNVGVEAYASGLPGNAYGFDVIGGTMWLDTCHARDEALADIRVESGSTLRLFNTNYRTLTIADATSLVAGYDPMNPV